MLALMRHRRDWSDWVRVLLALGQVLLVLTALLVHHKVEDAIGHHALAHVARSQLPTVRASVAVPSALAPTLGIALSPSP